MGLDIYLYEVQKIEAHRNKIWTQKDLEEKDIVIFDIDQLTRLPKTIVDNSSKIKVKRDYYNIPEILKDYGYEEDKVHISLVGMNSVENTFCITDIKTGEETYVKITLEDIQNKYIFSQINKVFACTMDEIAYQRKGLNDDGWDLLPENCEYSDDKDNVQKMVDIGGLSESFIENWVDDHTVFYAWW